MHDVYAYGMIAPSTLVELADPLPPEGGYAELKAVHPSVGGEAAGGAYVLARLGVSTKLDGAHLGTDEASRHAIETLTAAGVDCTALTMVDGSGPVTELILAHGNSRTVFGTYGTLLGQRAWNQPSHDDVTQSRLVCLDPFFGAESRQVAQWCMESGTPYVTVDDLPDSEVAQHAEVLIISGEFAARSLPTQDPHQIIATYTEACTGLVILTQGEGRLLSSRRDQHVEHHAPFAVDVRDTTGAGDSFRGGIIYGLLRGQEGAQLIRTASAVAAMVCQRAPSFLHSPTASQLDEFLAVR